jgi:undecaprenyl diphosphate synthase
MDGNGRWAVGRGLPRTAGHHRGAEAVRRTVIGAAELGIAYLTLYGFSSENWKRPLAEIDDLMGLLRLYLRSEIAELHRNAVRVKVIGERERLSEDLVSLIAGAEQMTAANSGLTLTVALSYSGRGEIVRATRRIGERVRAGEINPADIDEALFERHLHTAGMPDPDLVIRTSGEKRISNFLLWQTAYSEFVFIDRLWPDFTKQDLEEAIREFHSRDRRYGASASSR